MAARGPYAKGVAKRAEILDAALEVIAKDGYSGATVKQLADAVGLSQNGLLHYFGSKDALFAEIVRHHDEALAVEVDVEHTDFAQGLYERIVNAGAVSVAEPGMSQLQLNVAVAASEPDHAAHDLIRARYVAARAVATSALTTLQDRGEFPRDADPAVAATLIASALDGLQLLRLHDDSIDVPRHLAALLTALGVSADGVSVAPTSD